MAARPARSASLLTGHRVKKTKHLSQQKQWTKEKRRKEDAVEAKEPKEDEDANDHSDNSADEAQPKHQPVKQKQGKKKHKLDPLETDTNIFSLEVAEVLKEVRVDYAHLEPMEKALHSLRKLLLQLEDRNIDLEGELPSCLQLQNGKQSQIKFRFKRPRSVKLAGSYALHTVASSHRNLDLAVEVPSECFSATKDLKNHRYTDKRALYVYELAVAVEQSLGDTYEVKLAPWCGDVHRPVVSLRMRSGSDAIKGFEIRLIPVLSNTTFDADKLLPNVNNCHRNSHPDAPQPPTPLYNLAIVEDMNVLANLNMLHDALAAASAPIVDGLLLLKTWLALRNAERLPDSVTGFHLTVLVAYLLQERRLGTHLNALQTFRIALDFIATASATPSLALGTQPSADHMTLFTSAYDVVMLDPTHKVNLWGRVSRQAWAELQHEAQVAMGEMNSLRIDALPLLLQRRVPFVVRFDAYVRIRLPAPSAEPALSEANALCDVTHAAYMRRRVWELLSRGLGTRTSLMRVSIARSEHWSVQESAPEAAKEAMVGLLLNSEAAFRVIDLGPSPEQKEAAAQFREWWGERAELRRFKDGSILESAVWEEAGAAANTPPHAILHRVICHVLARHASVPPASVHFYDDQLAFALLRHGREQRVTSPTIIALFDKFQRQVRGLPELRLPVRAMHPAGAAFRYTEPWPTQPLPKTSAGVTFTAPLDIIVQLESSGAWPDDLEAIKCVRAAFYIHLGQLITQHMSLRTQVTAEFLDVFCEGFVFRLHIHHDRELVLLQRTETTAVAARRIRRRQVLRPMHNSTMHGLYSRYPAFGPAVRLAKAWAHSHLFSGHINEETLELLVASVFARPAPFSPPLSPLVAFVRFLHLLGHFEWASFALSVDPTNEMGRDGARLAQDTLEQLQSAGNAPAMYLATAYDRTESFWTKHKPSRMILHRLAAFARQAEQVLMSFLDGTLTDAALPALFHVSLREYDILIRLTDQAWPARQKRGKEVKNLSGPGEVIVGFEPVRLLVKELRRRFGTLALFFYNAMEGDTIGVVWRPAALEPRPFKVTAVEWSVPNARKGTLSTNFAEVVHDIEVIGGPLVVEVVVQKQH